MRRALLILLLLLMGAASGTARVIDGDTLELTDGQKLRLWGIDAPESSQRCHRYGRPWYCGNDAAAALEALVAGRKLTCDAHGWDQYGRVVAICRLDGADIGAELVRQGWALDYADHSGGDYADEQLEAEPSRRGLWSGGFVPPWESGVRR